MFPHLYILLSTKCIDTYFNLYSIYVIYIAPILIDFIQKADFVQSKLFNLSYNIQSAASSNHFMSLGPTDVKVAVLSTLQYVDKVNIIILYYK